MRTLRYGRPRNDNKIPINTSYNVADPMSDAAGALKILDAYFVANPYQIYEIRPGDAGKLPSLFQKKKKKKRKNCLLGNRVLARKFDEICFTGVKYGKIFIF